MNPKSEPKSVAVEAATDFRKHPGLSPRKKYQISMTVQYVVIAAVILFVIFGADWADLSEKFFNAELIERSFPELFTVALANTVIYTASGYVVGFALGILIAVMRLSSAAVNRWIATGFIEIFRGLPALLILTFLAFFWPVAFPNLIIPGGNYGTVALGLGLCSAAYMAETFRAGIQAVPKGQMEAARSLGMSHTRAMVTIILPQAVRIVIPPLTNELILLTKDSSLVLTVGIAAKESDLVKFGNDLANETGNSTPLVVAGLAFLVITIPLSILVRRLEARQAKAR
ncbi:amino acid ABC transporter permease [Stackebrandtia nassauensis]|uniref:Polar amino acid ABC transporter, inner membrane subunit n=1 Tax=Stackebrandtia nassauensis (strain DSM 44728 / CIP 108903 / NRRL B-16338 / NBRC 102104 / LLR-40K-21) TaxID=446470 RepID=D3Q606_STANL|nr:amino acid ABC transporter permease [Stackebrandtia nassauensis]ADD40305.1 polar amino acid ABC transporter, inner membrane subunit [Stackebrandtia nassauensis DSM 44728]